MKMTIKVIWTFIVLFGLFIFCVSILSLFIQIEIVERVIVNHHQAQCGPNGVSVRLAGPRLFERRCIKKEVFLD